MIKTSELLVNINNNNSMLFRDDINIIMRGGIIILIIINITLFLYSNISIGASLYIKIFVDNNILLSPPLFSFSFFNSIKDIWDAKIYYIAILIFVLSGTWPYIKLILMIICWIFPVSILNVKYRKNILIILDFLGKWSLIDAILLIIMMCLFDIEVSLPIKIRFFLNPQNGIYIFILATILSYIICHIILYYDDDKILIIKNNKSSFITKFSTTNDNYINGSLASLENINNKKYKLTLFGTLLLLGLWFISIILITISIFINTFSFKMEGYLSIFLEYINSQIYKQHSIFSLIISLPYYSDNPNTFYIRWLQLFLFTFTIIFPLLFIIIVCFLLFHPLYEKYQKYLLNIAEYLKVSSIIEVFVLSIIVSVCLLDKFVNFIVGKKCDYYINEYFKWSININDNKCFNIDSDFLPGFWVLLISTIIHIFISNILLIAFNYSLYNKKIIGLKYIIKILAFSNIIK